MKIYRIIFFIVAAFLSAAVMAEKNDQVAELGQVFEEDERKYKYHIKKPYNEHLKDAQAKSRSIRDQQKQMEQEKAMQKCIESQREKNADNPYLKNRDEYFLRRECLRQMPK